MTEFRLNLIKKIVFLIYLFAASDRKLPELLDIIDKYIHKTEFIGEAHQNVEARWMHSNTECFFAKLAVDF